MELSPYELQRAENIRQNNARLEALGLEGQPQGPPRQPAAGSSRKRRVHAVDPEAYVRRSTRRVTRVDYTEPNAPAAGAAAASSSSSSSSRPEPASAEENEEDDAATAAVAVALAPAVPFIDDRPPAEDRSTRAVSVAVADILESAGRPVAGPSTKESVVALLACGGRPRFSKYLGALEWRNAVSLFVNVGGAEYNNLFLDGGRQITWFAGSQQHEETPIVRRLLGTSQSSKTTVLLFCRLVVPKAEPYVCCGQLRYVSHDFRRRPLKFTWALENHAELKKCAAFVELLNFK